MRKEIYIAALAFLPMCVSAQTSWSLKSCIEYGLTNNRNNVIYANEKLAADARAKEALSAYLPTVSLDGGIDNNIKAQTSIIPAGVFGSTDTRVAFTKKYNTTATAQLDQTIFDKSLITGLQANKYNLEQADLNIKKSKETIIYNVSNAYFQTFIYFEQLSLLNSNLETYQKQKDIIELQVKKGTKIQKDLDKIVVDYNNALSQIRVAESNQTLAMNQLKYEMGFPMDETIQIDKSAAQNALTPISINSSDKNGLQLDNLTDYHISQVNLKLLEIDEKQIRDGMYPKLSFFARYGAVGFGDNLGQSLKVMSPYSAVGVKLNFPILNFFKRNAQQNQAKFKRMNAEENIQLNKGRYLLDYENARTRFIKEKSNVENNLRNIDLARSVFQVTDLQFQKGTTDLTDWLNSQNSLKEAQNSYLQSLYNLALAKVDLEKATGNLHLFYKDL
ncbi:MAG: TolC family protein [Sphingobacterium sp.]|jgi:outer membrane protein TolC|nr:TolC family protein [Sphingobacterium sp.]